MVKALKPLTRAPLLYVSVQDAIKDYIFENNLQPGDPLPSENELSDQLGVSRNSVREAVKSLISLGVVDSRRGSGLFVQSFSLNPLLDSLPYALMSDLRALEELLDVRRILEGAMIGEAIATFSEADLHYFDDLLARMYVFAQQGVPCLREDREFHQRLFINVGNQVLLKLLDIFWIVFRKAAQHADVIDVRPMSTYNDHVAIVEAIKARDVDAARAALERHYDKNRHDDSLRGRLERMKQERHGERQPPDANVRANAQLDSSPSE
jgi:DNA-binding FadR family transcriptional regulator